MGSGEREEKSPQGATVGEIGEEEIVAVLRRLLHGEAPGVRLGPGDDAALVDAIPPVAVLTSDLMVEDVHFRRSSISPRDLGHKALSVNVSDVAAMGGTPRYALVALGLPPDVEVAWVVA